ncbi:MAG: CARDB domain-containing protein [bacterium F083]|nr:MAG: CARDB domain-containing protein [bacterium F083]
MSAVSQITTVYRQGFEASEATTYTVVQGSASPQTAVAVAGSRALKLEHNTTGTMILFDTINLNNGAWQHFALEFFHINNVDPTTCDRSSLVGVIEVKRPGVDNDWTKVTNNFYNVVEGAYSTDFFDRGSFCSASYEGWDNMTVSDNMWKRERFDFDVFLSNQSAVGRKLLIRMTLMARNSATATTAGWYIDDVVLKASPDPMITPMLSMVDMPDAYAYPSSRGARIAADITTTVSQGMDPDSIYVAYKVGSDPTEYRLPMAAMSGVANRYEARIPFYGYDTVMQWRLVARDFTSNRNTVTYPSSSASWCSYACVRGTANSRNLVSDVNALGGSVAYPFPLYGDNRSEFIVDSIRLHDAGYRAGAITSMTFTTQQNVTAQQLRERLQVRMANVPTTYAASENGYFYNGFMKAVYDDAFIIEPSTTGSLVTVFFQDTFFYAGQDILVRITYDNSTTDPGATSVRVMPVTDEYKKTVYVFGNYANLGSDFFNEASFNPDNMFITTGTTVPHVLLGAHGNMPMMYDCGVSALAYPNEDIASRSNVDDSVVVWLKNYGSSTINSVPVYYSLDNGAPVSYLWTGTLAAGDSTRVRVSTTQRYTVGFHSIKAWVGDTLTVSGVSWRDHEPYNDTVDVEFIACAGAMNGVRRVGGDNADYATMEQFLFSLSHCGVDGPLTVKLTPGRYDAVVLPVVPGLSSSSPVTFEPLSDSVWFEADVSTTALVDLQRVAYIRFRNIGFARPASATATRCLVQMASSSPDCRFVNCWLADSGATPVAALIATTGADSLLVDSCSLQGGAIGLDLTGLASDNHSRGSRVAHSDFRAQNVTAVKAVYQDDLTVDSNWMNNVKTNASYVLLFQSCGGQMQVTANKIYTSNGASAMGLADIAGTAQHPAVFANNMIVSNDDGRSVQLATPLNIISARHTLIAYNSVKLVAGNRRNVATVTLGSGSGVLTDVRLVNNVIACMDASNLALNYDSRSATNTTVGHNVYYSAGSVLNKYINTACSSLAAWQTLYPSDSLSRVVEPAFLDGGLVDLRAYNPSIKGCGIPLTEVVTDMFGTSRDMHNPCAGALEFEALYYDFSIESVSSPEAEYCSVPASIPLHVVLHNAGVRDYDPSTADPLTLCYSCGSQTGSVAVTCSVPAGDTAHFYSTQSLQLSGGGQDDVTHDILLWLTSSIDPNTSNDTLRYSTLMHYNPSAPDAVSMTVPYATAATVPVSSGVASWPIGVYSSGRTQKSRVYWYADSLTFTPFHEGDTLVTGLLYDDTSYYVSQRRDLALIKITEVQVSRTAAGVTSPYPDWFGGSTKFAVELTNVGDYPANLSGDTIQLISGTSTYNKIFVLPDVVVLPGATLVLQFYSGVSADSSKTLYYPISNSNASPAPTTGFAVLYRDGGGLADVAAFNSITTQSVWTSAQIPGYLWTGTGVVLNSGTAGAKRVSWPADASATPDDTKNHWALASVSDPMTLGAVDSALILYEPSVCDGERAKVSVTVSARPAVDLAIEEPVVPEGCGLAMEPLTVVLRNYGTAASPAFTVYYTDGTTSGSDVISTGIAAGGSLSHTFTQPLNMHAMSDTTYRIRFWIDACTGDVVRANDTVTAEAVSLYTPLQPAIAATQTCAYGQALTLTPALEGGAAQSFRWYDSGMNELGIARSYTTPNLYLPDTFYVSGVGLSDFYSRVGSGTTTNVATSTTQPSPYNTVRRYAKEQYLYTAAELTAAGVQPGEITSLSFYLDTLTGTSASVQFTDFTLSIGASTQTEFTASGNNWAATQVYSSSGDFAIRKADSKTWITHTLDSSFVWDGVSSIVVQICRSLSSVYSSGLRTTYTSSANRALYTNGTTAVCSQTSAGTRSSYRPNIRFGQHQVQCEGASRRVVIALTGVPAYEAALQWQNGIDTVSFTSCAGAQVSAKVMNLGTEPLETYQLQYRIDGGAWHSVSSTPAVASGSSTVVPVSLPALTPGRHQLEMVVAVNGDVVASNDTIRHLMRVRFCAGDYTVGATGLYASVGEAVDTLLQAGVCGAVRFLVETGVYSGQLNIPAIDGASAANTVTFRSASGVASDVVVSAAPSSSANYVVNIADNAAHLRFERLTFYAAGTSNYNNVVTLAAASDIQFSGSTLRVKGTVNNTNASCVVVGAGVNNLRFYGCTLDSGYYSLKSNGLSAGNSASLHVDSCALTNFWYRGLDIDGYHDVVVASNTIRSGVTVAGRPLTGVYAANAYGQLLIEKNNIVLFDNYNGGKTGISVKSCQGESLAGNKVQIFNNMISLSSTGNNTDVSSGITLDGTAAVPSRYVEVYYNTVRLYTGDNKNTTTAFKATSSVSDAYVMNNIFSNFSTGYAYYVAGTNSIVSSDYNNYFSTSATRLAYWGAEMPSLTALRTASGADEGSLNVRPYYVSDVDLHLTTSNCSNHGLYNADIPDDIDGSIRHQLPRPTLGAHEYTMLAHDISIAEILHPTLSDATVEGDTLMVVATFYNNGASTETNVTWYAEVSGVAGLRSNTETIHSISSQGVVTDTTYIVLSLGLIDTQTVVVRLDLAGDLNLDNNEATSRFFLQPAYNLSATAVSVSAGSPVAGCNLQNATVSVSLKNIGRKAITTSMPLTIGYQVVLNTANVTVSTLPIWHEETVNLSNLLAVGATQIVSFATPANLYPTGLDTNISVKIRAWVHYEYDLVPAGDTTNYITKQSYYTPAAPVGVDLHIPYATTDTLWASQAQQLPIRWYRDSTASPFYSPTTYSASTHWNNAPQYFNDTLYYLNCLSDKRCPSPFSPIHVYLNARVAADVSAISILTPATGRVYVDRDTVTVRITNYSNQAISNIPVVYRFYSREGSTYNLVSEVREVYAGPLSPDATVDYMFDSLLTIPSNYFNTSRTYRVTAWTDLDGDMVRQNDTVNMPYTFVTRAETAYCTPTVSNNDGMDLTRISLNSFDWEMPAVGRGYLNLASFTNSETGAITLPYGMVDTLTVQCANSADFNDSRSEARLSVYIDYDRSGSFSADELVMDELLTSRRVTQFPLSLPASVVCGHMKARIILNQDTSAAPDPCAAVDHGNIVDLLLYVMKDLPAVDLAPAHVVTAYDRVVDNNIHDIRFVMVNKGSSTVRSADIHYTFYNRFDSTTVSDSFTWTGSLASGLSACVTLPSYDFMPGTTDLTVAVNATGDDNSANDTLRYQFHRFHTMQLTVRDNFDGPDYWYAPEGYNAYSRNYWELGTPSKQHIDMAYSAQNAWTTGLDNAVATGRRGTVSMLYSPIFDVSQIQGDSLSFMLAKNFTNGSYMYVEYLDAANRWTKMTLSDSTLWYDSEAGFTGTTTDNQYVKYQIPTSSIVGVFAHHLQLRFVYYTPVTSNANSAFSDGCAIDNFVFHRAQRSIDVGVYEITAPTQLSLGMTVAPTVTLVNYGFDTIRSVQVAYRPYGSYLAREEVFSGVIAPNGGMASFTFSANSAFTVTSDYPEEFSICAFTRSTSDLYRDNDTACQSYILQTLENDVEMVSILTPGARVMAGDSVSVTIRLRNHGSSIIASLPVVLSVNESVVEEVIDFTALMGRQLASMEYFNYTFTRRFPVALGVMNIMAYSQYEDDYRLNDTVAKRVVGISSLTDLKAKEIVLDGRQVQLVVENVGSLVASGFTVGYFYDDDISTVVRQTYSGSVSALSSGYVVFNTLLPMRASGYNRITAFVHIDGDNDASNDTTSAIVSARVDIQVNKLQVEENMNDNCRVRMLVENVGNFTHQGNFTISAVINGTAISTASNQAIAPGAVYALDFGDSIPKSSQRSYVGTGVFTSSVDVNDENNQTSLISVLNSFEGVPDADEASNLELEQNYPNPFSRLTTIAFNLPQAADVRLFVMDAMGRLCYQWQRRCEAGRTAVTLDADEMHLSTGVFFYGIDCEGRRLMRKMIIR